tara:strand:- start:700 stop:1251 length:552 start_codon:yes stop_codon:yes gene_type:complete
MKKLNLFALFLIPFLFFGQTYEVDISKSNVEWLGKKPTGSHYGTILIKDGSLELDENGEIISGEFTLDMNSISCDDLSGNRKESIDGHLKDEDFFHSIKYPTSKFIITKVSDETIWGNLTIKDKTELISFDYTKLDKLEYNADIIIDRTKFDIKYKSKSFFSDLGDRFIYDNFNIKLNSLFLK